MMRFPPTLHPLDETVCCLGSRQGLVCKSPHELNSEPQAHVEKRSKPKASSFQNYQTFLQGCLIYPKLIQAKPQSVENEKREKRV